MTGEICGESCEGRTGLVLMAGEFCDKFFEGDATGAEATGIGADGL